VGEDARKWYDNNVGKLLRENAVKKSKSTEPTFRAQKMAEQQERDGVSAPEPAPAPGAPQRPVRKTSSAALKKQVTPEQASEPEKKPRGAGVAKPKDLFNSGEEAPMSKHLQALFKDASRGKARAPLRPPPLSPLPNPLARTTPPRPCRAR